MKKLLSILLIISLVCTFTTSSLATGNVNEKAATTLTIKEIEQALNNMPNEIVKQFPELQAVIAKTKVFMRTEKDPVKLEKKILKSKEYKELQKVSKKIEEASEKLLRKKYKLDTRKKVVEYMETEEYKEFEERVNIIAQEIYDYHSKYGKYPEESELTMSTTLTSMAAGYVMSPSEAVNVFEEMGYIISEYDLGKLATTLGSICGLDGPLPIGEIVALAAGIAIISYYVYDYYDNKTSVCNELEVTFDDTAAYLASSTITQSYAYAIQRQTGYKYIISSRSPGKPGGIVFGSPVDFVSAVAYLKVTVEGVYTPLSTDAKSAADAASLGSPSNSDSAHTSNGMTLNLPHYHPTLFFIKQDAHSWWG